MRQHIRNQLTDDMLAELMQHWGATTVAECAGGAVNLIYDVTAGNQPLIFRITDDSRRTAAYVDAELHWIFHLKRCGLTVCAPVPSSRGMLMETCQANGRQFFAAAFERARGVPVRRSHLDRAHMIALGRMLGHLHAASMDYPTASRMNWDYNLPGLLKLVHDDPEAHDGLMHSAAAIAALPRDRNNFGLVHNDLHMHNYFIEDDTIWLFDFDCCLYNWFASDIACTWYFALSWLSGKDRAMWQKIQQPILSLLLQGYRQVHPISQQWIEQLPLFFRFRALSLYAYFSKRYGENSESHDRSRVETARFYALADVPVVTPTAR
jgi:Ser/Thr protein kinase RdoA (MazF antagonist)